MILRFNKKLIAILAIGFLSIIFVEFESGALLYDRHAYSLESARFHPSVSVSYYPAEGQTASALKSSMLERGPLGHGGKRFYAYTLWHMKLIKTAGNPDAGLAGPSFVRCYIAVHLPSLRTVPGLSRELMSKWETFRRNMVKHEQRHVSSAIRACRFLRKTGSNHGIMQAVARRLKSRDNYYDHTSRHGILEGVALD